MSVVRGAFRFVGWLLTPLVAWAASFAGAWIGAAVSSATSSPITGLWITVIFGVAAAVLGALAWLRFLRKSPKLQEALALAPDGTPLVALEGSDEPDVRP